MKKYDTSRLLAEGYNIENAVIDRVDLSMADHGVLDMSVVVKGYGWGCSLGGYVIGKGYLGAKEFEGFAKGTESIMRIMDVVGVDHFSMLKGKHVRVASKGCGSSIKIIGNIIKENWFDYESFFADAD